MLYPNAANGVRKIFLAEVLAMVAALIMGVASILAPSVVAGTETAAIPTVYILLMVSASVLGIVSFIINIIGINNARPDENNFMLALWSVVAGIVLTVASVFFQNNAVVTRRLNSVITLAQMFASYYVLTAIMTLAGKLNDSATEKKARVSRYWLIGAFLISAPSGSIIAAMAQDRSGPVIAVGLVYIAVQMIAYIIYLRALAAGRTMLNSH